MAVFVISQQILTNIAQINAKAKDNYLWEFGFAELKVVWLTLGDWLNRSFGLTEPLLWIQLVAEGSPSQRRAFGEAMTKARRVNVEGSVFQ